MCGEVLKAKVLAVDSIHVYICCPICGIIHMHGSNGNMDKENYGHRLAHCSGGGLPWINGYFKDNPRGDSYELICTPETVRQNEDADKYVEQWYKENRRVDYLKERRQIALEVKEIAVADGITREEAYEELMRNKRPEIQIP